MLFRGIYSQNVGPAILKIVEAFIFIYFFSIEGTELKGVFKFIVWEHCIPPIWPCSRALLLFWESLRSKSWPFKSLNLTFFLNSFLLLWELSLSANFTLVPVEIMKNQGGVHSVPSGKLSELPDFSLLLSKQIYSTTINMQWKGSLTILSCKDLITLAFRI